MNDGWMESAWDKVARADEHLEALYAATDGWGDPDSPLRISRECDPHGFQHTFRVHYVRQPDVPRWALLVGDALNNLRAALDHTVYALAVAQTRKDPPDDDGKLMFPICSKDRFFMRASVQRRIRSLDGRTRAAIERAQPYNRVKPDKWFMPLWWLSALNDIDKHRIGHVATAAAHLEEGFELDPDVTLLAADWNIGFLEDGAPIFRLLIAEPKPDVYVNFEATASVVLRLGKLRPLSLAWTMHHIRDEVILVCRYLSMFFPPGSEPGGPSIPSFDPKRYGDAPPPRGH